MADILHKTNKHHKATLEIIVALVTAVIAIINIFVAGVHGIYSTYMLIILSIVAFVNYFERQNKKTHIPHYLRMIGLAGILLIVVAPWSTIAGLAYTGTPESALTFIIWMIFVTISIINVHQLLEEIVELEGAQNAALTYWFALLYILAGWLITAAGTITTIALISVKKFAAGAKALATLTYGAGITLFGFEITPTQRSKSRSKERYQKWWQYVCGILLAVVGGMLLWKGQETTIAKIVVFIAGALLIMISIIDAKNHQKLKTLKKYVGAIIFVNLPYILLIVGPLFGMNYTVPNCTANFTSYGNKILAYGPQEIIMHTPDNNVVVIKPWQKIIFNKDTFCESKYTIFTAFGRIACNPTAKICK
ncbi:MAG: hypothetical protein GXN93_04675 [Candidatus Diapherotrites archaeon]|nr:hypothetical protein [Candidatus Diapherotrites archaeon]